MDYTKLGQSNGGVPVGPTGGTGPSSPVSISRVDSSNAVPMLQLAWTLTKQHYSVIGPSAVIFLLIIVAFGQMGSFSILAVVPGVILNAGFLRLIRKLLESKSAELTDLFVVFRETELLIKLVPIILVGIGVGAIQYFVTSQMGFLGSLLNLFLSLVLVALTAFSVPLMMFKGVELTKSIELNVQATTLNWEFMLASGFMLAGLSVICALMLVLPFFLVAFPIALVSGYFMYVMMFDGAELSDFK
jgi:hypothetical protein